jgi:hypothetical protein
MIPFERLPFSPKVVQARWVLGTLPSEDSPAAAQAALENGYDGRNTRRIAGLIHPHRGDLLPLMPGFLLEIGAATELSVEDAAWILIREIAKGIIDTHIPAYDGARFIGYDIVNGVWPNQQHAMLVFTGLASDYEDCESYTDSAIRRRKQIEQDIIEQAQLLLR